MDIKQVISLLRNEAIVCDIPLHRISAFHKMHKIKPEYTTILVRQ